MRAYQTETLRETAQQLRAGERVLLSGTVYTARDAAHKRLAALLKAGEPLPFSLREACIFYAGPTPTRPGQIIGSCGPTTSGRMDPYTPLLLSHGLRAMIGKGERSQAVCDAMRRNAAVYFCAVGGAGALAAQCIIAAEVIAFPELGCESIKRMTIKELPLIVAIDVYGENLFHRQ